MNIHAEIIDDYEAQEAEATRAMQLRNCASWHIEKRDHHEAKGERTIAERHDMIAFRLFKRAREIVS